MQFLQQASWIYDAYFVCKNPPFQFEIPMPVCMQRKRKKEGKKKSFEMDTFFEHQEIHFNLKMQMKNNLGFEP